MTDKPAPTCPGYCCEAFSVGSPEDFRSSQWHHEDFERVRDMLVYLGEFEGNPTGRTPCGKLSTRKVEPGDPAGPNTGHFHTCRLWDKETRLCTIYEERPTMCRTYPNRDVCVFEGCDVGPTQGPHAGKTKTEVLAIQEQEARVANDRRIRETIKELPELLPRGTKRAAVKLTRPATVTVLVSVLVPEDADAAQVIALAESGLANADLDRWRWDTEVAEDAKIGVSVFDVRELFGGDVDGPGPVRKGRPYDALTQFLADEG